MTRWWQRRAPRPSRWKSRPTRRRRPSRNTHEIEIKAAEAPRPFSLGLGRLEGERQAVHAVAQAGGLRPVIKHMPQMTAAAAAMHFGALHEQGMIVRRQHRIGQRAVETRPAGAAVEFGVGRKKVQGTAGAGEDALAMFLVERRSERRFGIL